MLLCGLQNWLAKNAFGNYISELEQQFLQQKLTNLRFGTILQIGFTSWQFKQIFATESQYIIQHHSNTEYTTVIADVHALPWRDQSIDTLIWPHGLDELINLEDVLREVTRILVPGGSLLLTGLNSRGYWRFFYRRQFNLHNWQPRSAAQVASLMQKHHLFLTEGQFLGYGLTGCYGKNHQTIELMGNRWWPHLAAVYGLVLVKRDIPLTLIPDQAKSRLATNILGVKAVPLCAQDQ